MRISENYSHIASLQFAYCKSAIRILQTDFSNTFLFFSYSFLSRPEGAVGPIFLNYLWVVSYRQKISLLFIK